MKRTLSIFLCLVLLLGILPVMAMADDVTDADLPEADAVIEEMAAPAEDCSEADPGLGEADTRNYNASNRPIVSLSTDQLWVDMTPANVTVKCESSGCTLYNWTIYDKYGVGVGTNEKFELGMTYRIRFTLQAKNSSNLFDSGVKAEVDFGGFSGSASCVYISSDKYYASFDYFFAKPAMMYIDSIQLTQINQPYIGGPIQKQQFATNNSYIKAQYVSWVDVYGNSFTTFKGAVIYNLTLKLVPDANCILYLKDTKSVTANAGNVVMVQENSDGSYRVVVQFRPNPFIDVPKTEYYFEPVMWAYSHNPQITSGTNSTHFSPNAKCTRAQVVTFLWRAKGAPSVSGSNPFTDVPSSEYYYTAVLWAVKKGITTGDTPTKFAPDKSCTRAQVVTFLWRARGKPSVSGSIPFTDVPKNEYYYKAVLWAVEQGITQGDSSTKFAPNKTCTRAQVVTFLYRAYGPKG